MRNIIVCADGTWNTPDHEDGGIPAPTNVVRLYNCVADSDDEGKGQLAYFDWHWHNEKGNKGRISLLFCQ